MEKEKDYRSFRLSKEMIATLKDIRFAFEACYLEKLSNDQLVQKLIDCIEDGDPGVWENYCRIREKKNG